MQYCDEKAVLDRIRRINGQVAALETMYQERRTTQDILQQIMALRAALSGLGISIADCELRGLLKNADAANEGKRLVETITRLG